MRDRIIYTVLLVLTVAAVAFPATADAKRPRAEIVQKGTLAFGADLEVRGAMAEKAGHFAYGPIVHVSRNLGSGGGVGMALRLGTGPVLHSALPTDEASAFEWRIVEVDLLNYMMGQTWDGFFLNIHGAISEIWYAENGEVPSVSRTVVFFGAGAGGSIGPVDFGLRLVVGGPPGPAEGPVIGGALRVGGRFYNY